MSSNEPRLPSGPKSEPHKFEPKSKGSRYCAKCNFSDVHPIHTVTAADNPPPPGDPDTGN